VGRCKLYYTIPEGRGLASTIMFPLWMLLGLRTCGGDSWSYDCLFLFIRLLRMAVQRTG